MAAELVRVVILAWYTGQRRGDLISLTWRAYGGRAIRVVRERGSFDRPSNSRERAGVECRARRLAGGPHGVPDSEFGDRVSLDAESPDP